LAASEADVSTLDQRCLETFPRWLASIGQDALLFSALLGTAQREGCHRRVAAILGYLFKSVDLIPDGLEDIGMLDDAFVLRVGAALLVLDDRLPEGAAGDAVRRLATDVPLIEEFLGADILRLCRYVETLGSISARGRTPDDVVRKVGVRRELIDEVEALASRYQAPRRALDAHGLIKLSSFLAAKLP
jgi:uncharacterized membrane protein YkvA (DUF1232 family)